MAALAALRASAKRDDEGSVGRFGVGFAAVLGLSTEPEVHSAAGGVVFSQRRTAEEVAALPGPAAELARRGAAPVLRLVWPAADAEPVPPGFTTEVRLPLRAGLDPVELLAQARASAPDLLLALPGLVEIDVDGTVVRRTPAPARDGAEVVAVGDRHWLLARGTGTLAADARDTAVEQRERARWTVTWALPVTADGRPQPLGADVAHAPTPTTERLELPARLVATLPLEPDRRRVRPGPATDAVVAGAAAAYLDLVAAVAPADRAALVPEPGFPLSPLHGALREALLARLRRTSWLPAADGGELVPEQAEWLDVPGASPALARLLAETGKQSGPADDPAAGEWPFGELPTGAGVPDRPFGRLAAPGPDPRTLDRLGAERITAAALVERLFGLEQPAAWWRAVYAELAELADTVPGLLDDLRALPVPLAGDEQGARLAAGPAAVLLPADPPDPAVAAVAALAVPGLYVADPAAAHPLLRRLGATAAEPSTLLAHPALLEAVDRSVDDAEAGLDPAPLAEAVLALVAEVGEAPAELRALALPDADGRPARADELMLPDAALRPLLDAELGVDVVEPALAARVPRAALAAVGVLDGFAVLVDDEPQGPDHDLHDEEAWWDAADEPPARLVAVRDLDLVADDAWPAALALLAGDRDTRAAVVAPGGYAGWWLARHALLDGHAPGHWRLPSAEGIAALYDAAPGVAGVDEAVLAAIGVRTGLAVPDLDAAADLLDRLADPARHPDAALTSAAHAALAEAVADGRVAAVDLDLPDRVRALDGSVADVDVAVVLDAPWPAAVLPAAELVIGGDPEALAELLDLPVATAVIAGAPEPGGARVAWTAVPEVVVACDALGVAVPPGEVVLHDELWVTLRRPAAERRRVPVWRSDQGEWHADDPVRALLAVLAEPGAGR